LAARPLILIIDDQESVRSVCRSALALHGFDVLCARDGEEGTHLFYRNADEIALVLCDLTMPKLDGAETVRTLRSVNPMSRIILMSGYNTNHAVPRDLRATCGLLNKPFTSGELIDAILRRLGSSNDAAKATSG
jgi:two-component system cell cycle sensor histidine kinase/response regulator CckA